MAWALLIIVASVLAGTLLALLPQKSQRLLGPVRTFAFASALGVVLVHLLPEALAEMGLWAFLLLPLGAVVPSALGRLGAMAWRALRPGREAPKHLALEASYVGLLLHRVGDGIGLGIYAGELSQVHGAEGVSAALGAHAVPVVAIVVLTFDSVRGRGSALKRAVGLGLASVLGVLLARSVLAESVAHASGLLSAFVAGMLLHVVSHELDLQLPQTRAQKLSDLTAAVLGIATSYLGGGGVHHGSHADEDFFLTGLTELAGLAAAPLALGVGGAAVLARVLRRIPSPWPAVLLGPGVAPETFALTYLVLGPVAAAFYWVVVALWVLVSGRLLGASVWSPAADDGGQAVVLSRALFRRLESDLPYILVAAVLAVNLGASTGAGTVGLPPLAQMALALAVAVFCHVPVSAALIFGLPLLSHGLSLGALLVLLVAGPAAPLPQWGKGHLWGTGARPVETPVVWLGMAGLLLSAALAALGWLNPERSAPEWTTGGSFGPALASLTGVLMGWSILRRSFRGVFASLTPEHGHSHGHGHSHDHPGTVASDQR